jgi:hypothetical protein
MANGSTTQATLQLEAATLSAGGRQEASLSPYKKIQLTAPKYPYSDFIGRNLDPRALADSELRVKAHNALRQGYLPWGAVIASRVL